MTPRERDRIRPRPRRRGSFIEISLMDDEVRYLFGKIQALGGPGWDAAAVRCEILRALELVEPKERVGEPA